MKTRIKKTKLKMNLFCKFIFSFVFLVWASVTNAQIVINEIMYDLDGSDSGKEWIEILNNGSEDVDIIGWRFFEAETNHKINLIDGKNLNFLIPKNSYAIIVDNFDKFSVSHPNFSGLVFDSAFSLSNSGENLILRNSDLNDIDNISYTSDWGASGDGNSLQLIDGNWIASNSTIGQMNQSEEFFSSSIIVESPNNNTAVVVTNTVSSVNFDNFKIYANAGDDKTVVVGSLVEFRGQALGLEKEPLSNARYLWTFGDGSVQEGQNVAHFYNYPGDYVVVLNVSSGEYVASDRILVKVVLADIVISKVNVNNNFVELFNQSKYELNLSGWRICSNTDCFTLPKDTIILPDKKLIFSSQTTGLNIFDANQVSLLYPNGEVLYTGAKPEANLLQRGTSGQVIQGKTNSKFETLNSKQIQNSNIKIQKTTQESKEVVINDKNDKKQLALVGASAIKKDGGLVNKWTFSLIGLILISITSVLFLKGFNGDLSEENEDSQLKPSDFKIID